LRLTSNSVSIERSWASRCSRNPGFKSWLGYLYSIRGASWFSSVPVHKCWNSTSDRPKTASYLTLFSLRRWSIFPSTIHSSSVVIYVINKVNSEYSIYLITGKQSIVTDVAPHIHYNKVPFLTVPFMSEVKWRHTHALYSSCPTPTCRDTCWREAVIINASLISQPSDNFMQFSYYRAHPLPLSLELDLWPAAGCSQSQEVHFKVALYIPHILCL